MKRKYQEKRPKQLGPMLTSRTIPELPCYHRALCTAGLIDKGTGIPESFEIFTIVSGQPEVRAARERVRQKQAKRVQVTVPFALTIAALALLTEEELRSIKLRLLYQSNEGVRVEVR